MNSISTPLTLLLGVACLCELFVSAGRSQEERGDVRFFKYNVLSVDQEMVLEAFDLGQVRAGEKLKIQLYIRNFTKSDLRIWQTRDAITQIQLEPGTVTVAPGEGALVQATLDVPTNPRVLDKAFDMEAQLSDSCRLRGSFTSKIVDVMAFVSDEMTFEFGELDAEGRTLTVTIPLLLSDLSDARRLLAKCDEQSSFVSLSLVNNENTLSLLATFDPRNIKGDSHVVQIDLKRSGVRVYRRRLSI